MNKVVCNVCGTSYPESAAQCPICGFTQPADKAVSTLSGERTYTYVKGGRFSKANVKKRNQAKTTSGVSATNTEEVKEKSNAGMIVLIIVLLLAIIAVSGYIALRFFLPNNFIFEGLGGLKSPSASQNAEEDVPATQITEATEDTEATEVTTVALDCTAVSIDTEFLSFDAVGSTHQLIVTLEPEETHDPLTFTSSDETVVTVDANGLITVTGEGNAVITVTCGSVHAECDIVCEIIPELTLNRKEITFDTEGQNWLLYNGEIPVEDIIWSSDDNRVATIESGKVVAVGEGTTTVYAGYEDQTASCVINCNFEESDEGTGEISEASGESDGTYMLYNPYSRYSEDVTIHSGEKFILKLVDKDLNEVSDAEWSVKNSNVCTINNNIVLGVSTGTTSITATYKGVTYTCVVHVN